MKSAAVASALLIVALCGSLASAHQARVPSDRSGVAIPSVSHGEMTILAEHFGDIMDLADRVHQPEPDFRTLFRHSGIQRADCLWGMIPGGISDEESPFNECSHAYLASAKTLLLRMRDMPQVALAAGQLVSEIDAKATLRGVAFIGCQYSGEEFNTAESIKPNWDMVPGHTPSLLSFAVILFGPMGCLWALARGTRHLKPAG